MDLILEFEATEPDGTEVTVQILQGYHEALIGRGCMGMVPDAMKEMRTTDGRHVQPREDGAGFEIIHATKRIPLETSDPKAMRFRAGGPGWIN